VGNSVPGFLDTNSINPNYRAEIAAAVNLGLISGLPGNLFNPSGSTNRAQAARMMSNLLPHLTGLQVVIDEGETEPREHAVRDFLTNYHNTTRSQHETRPDHSLAQRDSIRWTPELIAISDQFKEGFFSAWANDRAASVFPFNTEDLEKALENKYFYFAPGRVNTGYLVPDHIYVSVSNAATGFRRLVLHEIGHALGLNESLANAFAREFTDLLPEYQSWRHKTAFDDLLMDRVGKEAFWRIVFTSRDPEAAYARLWNESVTWLPYEDMMRARRVQYALSSFSTYDNPRFRTLIRTNFANTVRQDAANLLPLFRGGRITDAASLQREAEEDGGGAMFSSMMEAFELALRSGRPEDITRVQEQFRFMSGFSRMYNDPQTSVAFDFRRPMQSFLTVEQSGFAGMAPIIEARPGR
jgi:hypothetical protein